MFCKTGHSAARCISILMLALGLPAASFAETIRIGGTGSALGTMALLGEAFAENYPAQRIAVLPSLGSSGGIKALQGKKLEIAVTSRDLTSEEKSGGLSAMMYGATAFVFASHPATPAQPLTREAIAAIYSGKLGKWSNGAPIRLVLRPRSDMDSKLLANLSPDIESALNAAHAKRGMTVAITDSDAADILEKLSNSFGTTTLAMVLSENRNVLLFPVDGVKPSEKTLSEGSYALTKKMYLVTSVSPSPGTKQFVDFIRSPKGMEILRKTGHTLNMPR